MKYLTTLPVVAMVLVGAFAMAQTVSAPFATAADQSPAAAATDAGQQPGGPDKEHMRWHHHMRPHGMALKQAIDALPKPLAPDAVKQALESEFAKRPHVQAVTEKDANTLVVEIVDRDGNSHKFELNRTTGDHRKAW